MVTIEQVRKIINDHYLKCIVEGHDGTFNREEITQIIMNKINGINDYIPCFDKDGKEIFEGDDIEVILENIVHDRTVRKNEEGQLYISYDHFGNIISLSDVPKEDYKLILSKTNKSNE